MAWSWKILRSAVEQEILFPSKKEYEKYIENYFYKKSIPCEVVSEYEQNDGTYIVVMRKPYNNAKFLERKEV